MNSVKEGARLTLPQPQDLVDQGLPGSVAKPLLQLIASCWSQLAVDRPTMAEVADRLAQLVDRIKGERRAAAAAAATTAAGRSPAHSSSGGGRA